MYVFNCSYSNSKPYESNNYVSNYLFFLLISLLLTIILVVPRLVTLPRRKLHVDMLNSYLHSHSNSSNVFISYFANHFLVPSWRLRRRCSATKHVLIFDLLRESGEQFVLLFHLNSQTVFKCFTHYLITEQCCRFTRSHNILFSVLHGDIYHNTVHIIGPGSQTPNITQYLIYLLFISALSGRCKTRSVCVYGI